jgi:pimeloyl-ACP methyl ester carboxylesterase
MGVNAGSLHVPGILDLAQLGIRLIIPDQRGLGLRTFAILGHSYCGFLAIEYARRWPESPTHLILMATSAGPVSVKPAAGPTDADLREHFRSVDKHWPLFETLRFSIDTYKAAFTRELPDYDLRGHVAQLEIRTLPSHGKGRAQPLRSHWPGTDAAR